MPTMRAYASEIVRQLPGELWREETIGSLTTTTAVLTNLAVGGWSADKFTGQFIWRPDTTTTADKQRYATNFTSSTGTFTHAGTNYADTTATGEKAIITKIEPYIIRQAIDQAVQQLRQIDRTILPVRTGVTRYSLGDLAWVKEPSDILRVCMTDDPVISRNRYLQKRTNNTSGAWAPDDWTVTNNADATPYEAYTGYKDTPYRYRLERSAGVDATMVQTITAGRTGVDGDFPSGTTITAVAIVDPDTAGDVLLAITDGTSSDSSTGAGAGLQEITASITLAAAASTITVTITAQTSNASQLVYESYVATDINDSVRRDDYREWEIGYEFEQYGALTLKTAQYGRGQIIIYSKRPYPAFDSTRLYSGAVDADESDAPLIPVAAQAIANIMLGREGETGASYIMWRQRAERLALKHIGEVASPARVIRSGPMALQSYRVR